MKHSNEIIDISFIFAIVIVIVATAMSMHDRSQPVEESHNLICGSTIRPVEHAQIVDNDWILFRVKGDQPRIMPRKNCRIN